jgi:hypothetical protein
VEEAVSGQHRDLLEDVLAGVLGLPTGGGHADDDVSEDLAGKAAEFAFAHRERQDVGRAILFAIDFVQLMNSIVVS